MITIGKNISRKRREKNITQEELAEFMSVTKASVSKWETGQSYPDILLLPKLATFFDMTIDELIGYEPQLSIEEIRKIYRTFIDRATDENIEEIIDDVQSTVRRYYSCFELLYYMGAFIVHHGDLAECGRKRQTYLAYAEALFKRIYLNSEDSILRAKALNMRGVCLLRLGEANRVLDILPSSDELLTSTDCVVAAALLQTEEEEEVDKKLQIFIYKNIMDTVTLLTMKSGLREDDWRETSKKIEELIDVFNLRELNISLVLNFYLSSASRYREEGESSSAGRYLQKYLALLLERGEESFEIQGDRYFDRIDAWIEENFILGKETNKNKKAVYDTYASLVIDDEAWKNLLDDGDTKKLVERLRRR